ncbi:hypothetical protein BIY37_04220 [Candidatus Brocadia sapporoensis]|uniref:Uncharacterized protein n=1 Tax=Candidatus Brocadia sapporoensis TaxID=392547 RepID=A0A1V6M1L0_9BACT|nr:hypothetical protein BIY37_04220 [Candidatus Brocadia sapporoensis]
MDVVLQRLMDRLSAVSFLIESLDFIPNANTQKGSFYLKKEENEKNSIIFFLCICPFLCITGLSWSTSIYTPQPQH